MKYYIKRTVFDEILFLRKHELVVGEYEVVKVFAELGRRGFWTPGMKINYGSLKVDIKEFDTEEEAIMYASLEAL
ncbi:MAG: hypothetical protein PHW03_08980 [Eubacteriales bacterium]|nr:hypothetical protein [Eubacteriales bacterium]